MKKKVYFYGMLIAVCMCASCNQPEPEPIPEPTPESSCVISFLGETWEPALTVAFDDYISEGLLYLTYLKSDKSYEVEPTDDYIYGILPIPSNVTDIDTMILEDLVMYYVTLSDI
ncbi:MAG: hypothetical protein Q4D14_08245, partial [Bacteroidales bacterium]|nr:hypothetical protein [Bacteroidales bacterium]